MRAVSVAWPSRQFRVVELDGGGVRIEQAVRDPLDRLWKWHPRASATGPTAWREAHVAMGNMQELVLRQMERKQQP